MHPTTSDARGSTWPTRLRRFARFAYVWLMVGYAGGTLVLLGPIQWLMRATRGSGWGQRAEDALVTAVILLFVAASAAVAGWLARVGQGTGRTPVRWGVSVGVTAAAIATLAFWLHPRGVAGLTELPDAVGDRFVFGPYPLEDDLRRLRAQGFTAVISLLHPAVLPVEPKLIADERSAAERAGVALIHLPMLPWLGQNHDALDSLRALAASSTGRYYVHCYLGKDRVNVARRAIEAATRSATTADPSARTLADLDRFERGAIYELDAGLYLTPFPTDEEFFGYVIAGGVRTVVSLLDPQNPEDEPHIAFERLVLDEHGITLISIPLPATPFNPEAALDAARRARALPRPAVVHAFLSASPPSEGFVQAFRSDLPPVPPSLFREPLANGGAEVIAPHVVFGPTPTGDEFRSVLAPRGIRGVVWVAAQAADELPDHHAAAEAAGFTVVRVPPDPDALVAAVRRGGPWYVHGPGAAALRDAVAAAFGPPLGRP